ncbi:hypothetical protein OAP18_03685 [Gammaproteobacteria bacterium]|nr:hypothetical protein [Gammaproteobacteria bacterium]
MKIFTIFLFLLLTGVQSSVTAQEGFPLDGTWRGEWGVPGGEMTLAVVIMDWDGVNINGRINPGRNMVLFDSASLDPSNWNVHIEATAKTGEAIVIDGVLDNIGSYQRTMTGTWIIGGIENQITLTRE